MKKALQFGAVLCTLSGAALAQSSVTLSVITDLAVRHSKTSAGSLTSMVSGSNSTSRMIIRGSEDLGDGLRANFWLESTIAADTGVPGAFSPAGQFFDRQSTVSLSGKFGEVRLGRVWNPIFTGYAYTDPFVFVGVGSMGNFFNASVSTVFQRAFGSALNPTTISRSSNALEYLSPNTLGGFNAHLMSSFGENNNAGGSFKYNAGRLGYRAGPLDVSAYTGNTRIDATGANLKQSGVSGIYTLGVVRMSGSVLNSSYLGSKQTNIVLGAFITVGTNFIRVSYNRADQKGKSATGASIDANDAQQVALGYQYTLSKATALYTNLARLSNKGAAAFAVPGGAPGAAPGSSSTGYEIGLRTVF